MTQIIISKVNKKDSPYNPDAPKDCPDFMPLQEGSIEGDKKYCHLSEWCRQLDMYTEWIDGEKIVQNDKGEYIKVKFHDYMCTGKHAVWEERSKDEEAK